MQELAIRNLDYILTISSQAFACTSLDILANLEKLLDLKSSELWSYRRLPTPTATFPVVINSEEDDDESEVLRTRDNYMKKSPSKDEGDRIDSFLQPKDDPNQGVVKQIRALRKKLQQIEMLELKQSKGQILDNQQIAKLKTRSALESSLAELGVSVETPQLKATSPVSTDVKGNKRSDTRKQRRKSKQRVEQSEMVPGFFEGNIDTNSVKDFSVVETTQTLKKKVSCLIVFTFLLNKEIFMIPPLSLDRLLVMRASVRALYELI